jgi:pimeloyl-ACP methyl ester carboxylesterase
MRHRSIGSAIILWSVTGGAFAAHFLGHLYHEDYIEAAQDGGMEAVAETPFFAARIAENPANRERLLAMDPAEFIAVMRHWNQSFHARPSQVVAGITGDLGAVTVPALIFAGNDDIHPPEAAETLAANLPHARLAASPWSREEWMDRFNGVATGSVFDLYPRLVPQMLEFIHSLEASRAA